MGSGTGVKWIFLILLYFFVLSVVVTSYVTAVNSVGLDTDISTTNLYGDLAQETGINDSEIGEVSTLFFPTNAWTNIKSSFGLITGTSVELDIPKPVRYIFSVLFFWFPLIFLVGAIIVVFRA